jgi:hypothetical protein
MSLNESDILYTNAQTHEDDKRLFVRFSLEARPDRSKPIGEDGRITYKDIEFISIHIPGDKTLSAHRPVMAADRARFPIQYQQFKNKNAEQLVGTPLAMWPLISPAQIRELEYFNVRTVEHLASMPDSGAGQMMGIQKLKQAAAAYIQDARDKAPLVKVQKELEARDAQIAAQAEQITQMNATLEKLLANLSVDKPAKGKESR